MNDIILWIESHDVTVGILQWLALLAIAWFSGLFRLVRRRTIKPKLRIVPTASFVFLEEFAEFGDYKNVARASFVLNVGLSNRTNEKIVVEEFNLSFRARSLWRSYRQKLVRLAFPNRPRKRVGQSTKFMGVWFTEYPLEDRIFEPATGKLDPKDTCGGYLLFVSMTFGSWNPKIEQELINVKLIASLTSGDKLTSRARLRIVRDQLYVNEFCPGLVEHVSHESTWNHDLSAVVK